MLAHNVAFANRFDRNFGLELVLQNFAKCFRRSAWRVFFLRVMSLDNLRLKFRTENLRCTPCKSK